MVPASDPQDSGRSAPEPIAELARELVALIERARAAGVEAEFRGELKGALASLGREAAADTPTGDEAAYDSTDPPRSFGMVGASPAMQGVYELLEKVAPSDVSVLVLGETGTGKELVARALHDFSPRKKKPFLAENCAAVPANLLESELFGHVKGAFTGAVQDRPGHLVAADGGTVFLDEIGDMPFEMQAKLLRALQDGEVRPVGSNKVRKVDVRVVAATNKDLQRACAEGAFREDLYFRLAVITLKLPPLRDRAGDVRRLARFFVARAAGETGRDLSLAEDALAALEAWTWPGNVRELENEIRRASALCDGEISRADLSARVLGS